MSLWSILLRVLLSLSLILNGVATAGAVAHTHVGAADMQSPAVVAKVSQAGAEMPCHKHEQVASAAANDQPPAPPIESTTKSSPDCCKSSTCACACMHAAQATLPGVNLAAPVLDHSGSVRRLTLAHPAPALPHLIRPPIGQVS